MQKLKAAIAWLTPFDTDIILTPDHVEAVKTLKAFCETALKLQESGIMPRRRKEGRHDGHANDDRAWCHQCNRSDDEEEFTNNWPHNQAIDEMTAWIVSKVNVEKLMNVMGNEDTDEERAKAIVKEILEGKE